MRPFFFYNCLIMSGAIVNDTDADIAYIETKNLFVGKTEVRTRLSTYTCISQVTSHSWKATYSFCSALPTLSHSILSVVFLSPLKIFLYFLPFFLSFRKRARARMSVCTPAYPRGKHVSLSVITYLEIRLLLAEVPTGAALLIG